MSYVYDPIGPEAVEAQARFVREYQVALTVAGLYSGPIDGIPSPVMAEAFDTYVAGACHLYELLRDRVEEEVRKKFETRT